MLLTFFNKLISVLDAHGLLDWSPTALDVSNIRTLRCAAGAKKNSDIAGDNGLGRSRGGFGTKIHLATDGGGIPLNIVLSRIKLMKFSSHCAFWTVQNGSMKRCGYMVLAD